MLCPISGITYLRTIVKVNLIRHFVMQATMRSVFIIKVPVFFYHLPCSGKTVKDIPVEAFVSKLSGKAFYILSRYISINYLCSHFCCSKNGVQVSNIKNFLHIFDDLIRYTTPDDSVIR